MPDIQPVLIFADGVPVSAADPLPVTSSGGGSSDQGKSNGDATDGWSVRLTDGTAFIVPAKTGQLPAALGATTAAGSVAVGIATDQLSTLATAANQTTANGSLASILGQLDNKTSTLATEATASASKTLLGAGLPAALVGGKLDVNLGTSSITLPVSQGTGAGAAAPWSVQLSDGATSYTGAKTGQFPTALGQTTAAGSLSVVLNSNQVGTAGSSASTVLSVQGIASGTNLPVSQATAANLNATAAQGAGSGSAATFWYTRITDGTNTMPTMDAVGRAGFHKLTDGTNTAAVKAASTPAATTDPAAVVALSSNAPGLTVTMSSKSSSATSATMLSSNTARKAATFYNDDANPLYLRTDGSAATTSIGGYTVKLVSGAYYELPVGANGGIYQGVITGIWSAAGSTGVSISEST